MKKEDDIINYLKDAYNPVGIVLHGSRATNNAKQNSDWDIYVFVNNLLKPDKFVGQVFKGEQLDVSLIRMPLDFELRPEFVRTAPSARVVFDTSDQVNLLYKDLQNENKKGLHLNEKEVQQKAFFLFRTLSRLEDNVSDDAIFFLRIGKDFFPRAVNWWFEILNSRYSLPAYKALPVIENEDDKYFSLLSILYSQESNSKKLESAQKIFNILFPKFKK